MKKKINRISMYYINHLKLCLMLTAVFLCLLIEGCAHNQPPNNTNPTDSLPSPSILPNNSSSSIDSNIVTPPALRNDEPALLTLEQAKILIMSNIDITKYDLEVITSYLNINDERYYAFILKEDNIAHPPALIVSKDNPVVYCYEEDGTLTPFDSFPLYIEDTDNKNGWDGTFIHYDSSGNKAALIEIKTTDNDSFMFQIINDSDFSIDDITGSAEYTGNTATYSNNDTHVLLFVILDNTLSVTYTPLQSTSETSSAFMALFVREGIADYLEPVVNTLEDAAALLLTLTKKQTRLPDDINSYTIIPDKMTTYINGEQCYYINVYESFSDRKEFICTYYVTVNLNRIYMYDSVNKKDIVIYAAD